MQNTAHIIDYYSFKTRQAVWGRKPDMRNLATYTRAHDAYLIEHDKCPRSSRLSRRNEAAMRKPSPCPYCGDQPDIERLKAITLAAIEAVPGGTDEASALAFLKAVSANRSNLVT